MKRIRTIYCIFIAICMIGDWGFLLATGNVPEVKTEPLQTVLHISSELATAGILLLSAIGSIKKRIWAEKLFMLANGALLYSAATAAGYFIQSKDYAMLIMFSIIFVLSVFFSIKSIHNKDNV